jgi:antitoxin component YwqK of YwqJK toxin-antitoxin module
MGRAKEIIVKVIPSKIANEFVKKHHYSGKVVQNSSLHFGAFLDDKLHGVMSFGSSLDKSKTIGLVENTGWNDYLELNRMAFDEYLPKYAESRVISIAMKLIKKNAPQIKWVLSYADGCDCGDGTIYRASGFNLTLIKENSDLFLLPNGSKIHSMTIKSSKALMNKYGNWKKYLDTEHKGWQKIKGFQLRYIYLIDKTCKITVPILPFSKIDEMKAGMYKGKKVSLQDRKTQAALPHKGEGQTFQSEGAFDSTVPLNNSVINP